MEELGIFCSRVLKGEKMKALLLMPVFRRAKLACNAVACYLAQRLPEDGEAVLYVLDDGGTFRGLGFTPPVTHRVELRRYERRFPTLATKYSAALDEILPLEKPDIVLVYEDDDVYLPWHVKVHMEVLRGRRRAWSKPSRVLTDYSGEVKEEAATGSHGSIAFTADIESRWEALRGKHFDLWFMEGLRGEGGDPLDPMQVYGKPSYLFRWHTGYYHGQWYMNRPGNYWYEVVEQLAPRPEEALLVPRFDEFTVSVLRRYDLGDF
ncbi:MAG: hypothetical protein KatS3mg087_0143 [Patescibacteria group bacterium]|nr:MAG: hypothetical protein KatS3mg087_0143 [Patescibacteria group bacterium]